MKTIASCSETLFRREPPWVEYGLLILAVFIAYASVWPNEFVFDDIAFIVQNASGKHWDTVLHFFSNTGTFGEYAAAYYRPIPELFRFLVYQVSGLSTVGFHALSLGVHALNACLLYQFGIRAGFKKGAAFAAALLWAVHPLHTEAVTYMSATSELLWSTFCLCGLIVLLPDFTPRKVSLALVFFILALCSKGSAVIFPALVVATLFFVSKGRAPFSTYLKTWPLWMLAAGYVIAWTTFVHITGFSTDQTADQTYFLNYTSNMTNRILTSLATLPAYARLIVWPAGLHMERFFHVFIGLQAMQPVLGLLMAGAGFIQVFWTVFRAYKGIASPWALSLSFGLLWFAAALFPATGIGSPVNGLIAERWMYMPTMGLFLCVAQIAADIFEKRKNTAQVLVLVVALSLGIKTFFQNEVWRNTETLYQNIVQNDGNPVRLMGDLGGFYLKHREFDKAISLAQQEINDSVLHAPELQATPHMLLVLALLQFQPDIDGDVSSADDIIRVVRTSPHLPDAIRELDQVLQIDPDFTLAHQYLAIIYRYQGNNQLADLHDREAKEISQQQGIYGQQHIPHTGLLYLQWGQFDKAIEQLKYEADHTEGLSPVLKAEAHMKLAMAWLHLPPNNDGISFNLNIDALPSSEHIPQAIAELEKATQENPDFYFAHAALAALYRHQGDNRMADIHGEKASAILQRQGGNGR
jgi:tetratricopeptide (TPR) repeat protein